MNLRGYQKETHQKTVKAVLQKKNVLYVLPTGGGKTFIFTNIVRSLKKLGKSIIVVVHRKELLQQAYQDLIKIGILPAIIHGRKKVQKQVSVSMAKTLERLDIKSDVYIFDECHRGEFDVFFTSERYKKSVKIGCTATPIKNFSESKSVLSEMYDEYIEEASIRFLLRKKYLCNVKNIPYQLSTFEEQASGTDFEHPETIANVLDHFQEFEREKGRGKTLFFTANQKIAKAYMKAFEAEGNKCLLVTSDSKKADRENSLNLYHDLKSGYDFMFSCDILLTGYNFPEITRIVWLRSTQSLIVWLQGNGRGSRTTKQIYKKYFYCLDFGGNLARLGSWDADHNMRAYFDRTPEENQDEQINMHICPECYAVSYEKITHCLKCGFLIEEPKQSIRIAKESEALGFDALDVIKRFEVLQSQKDTDLYDAVKGIYLEFGRTALLDIFTKVPEKAKQGKAWQYDPEGFLEAFEDYYL